MRVLVAVFICCVFNAFSEPFVELTPNFSRLKSSTMVRKIAVPTLANLDYAAYTANPVRNDPRMFKPKASGQITVSDIIFSKAVTDVVDSIAQTPLTKDEVGKPLAWTPLQNRLWENIKTDALANMGNTINSHKWYDPSIFKQYQDVAAAYIHNTEHGPEIWVRIEFAPWVHFIKAIADNDRDGLREVYAKLNINGIHDTTRIKIFKWIEEQYCRKVLSREEIVDWANVMASYWYPTMNTDIIDMAGQEVWPTTATEKHIRKAMKNVLVKDPVIVIRGKPFQKPIYNVYAVDNLEQVEQRSASTDVQSGPVNRTLDNAASANFAENNQRFVSEIKKYGDYESWTKLNDPVLREIKKYVSVMPAEQMGLAGKDGWLFFRKSLEYITGGDLDRQEKSKNPVPHLRDFKEYLDKQNVSLLFVAIPNKEEVYPEKLPIDNTGIKGPYINPYSRKILKDLQDAGVEVIDLLPRFIDAKADDPQGGEFIYQLHDTHWTNRGIQIAADLIAKRIQNYAWYKDITKTVYTASDTSFERLGDIVDKMPVTAKAGIQPVVLEASQVRTPDGDAYKGNASAPIMLIGDSFTGVYELVDCKSAGLGSHIALKTGVPVDIVTSWGGGPMVRQKAMRARANQLSQKRLIVYVMVARDLYNYSQSWDPFPLDK